MGAIFGWAAGDFGENFSFQLFYGFFEMLVRRKLSEIRIGVVVCEIIYILFVKFNGNGGDNEVLW